MTYVAGSNILANMKHWVAIGGAGWTACGKAFAKFNAFAAAGGNCMPVPIKKKIFINYKLKFQGREIMKMRFNVFRTFSQFVHKL